MLKNIKKWIKLNNWKRWLILFFTLGIGLIFIGLSFGLKINENKLTHDYKNGITLVIKPTENGKVISDEDYSKQQLLNLENRLEKEFPNSYVSSEYQEINVWKVDITNILNQDDKVNFLDVLLKKHSLTLTSIKDTVNSPLYQNIENHNNLFNLVKLEESNIMLYMSTSSSKNFYNFYNSSDKIVIWKNFNTYKDIVQYAIDNENYSGSLYEFLFVDGWTPEKFNENNTNASTRKPIFKDYIIDKNGKKYLPIDFIVSKNDASAFNATSYLTISKDFGVNNYAATKKEIENEYYKFQYWISNYSLDDYIVSFDNSSNGKYAYQFLIISFLSLYLVLSIFIVINYGYLGIFAIFLISIIISLMLLMMTFLFGDYDSIAILSIFISTTILLDFIFSFFDSIKKQFIKGNSVIKATKIAIRKVKLPLFLKSIIMLIITSIIYGFLATIYAKFTFLMLIVAFSITFIALPLLFIFANLVVGIKMFENNPKVIGFWKNEYQHINKIENSKEESIIESLGIDETLEINSIKNDKFNSRIYSLKMKQWNQYAMFKKFMDSKISNYIVLTTIGYILVFGFIIFLVSYFNNNFDFTNSFFLSNNERNSLVLTIGKPNNGIFTLDEINQIKSILKENNLLNSINFISDTMIQVISSKSYSTENINKIIISITNLSNIIIIPSSLVSNDVFEIFKWSLLAMFIATCIICLFIFIWMKWTNALSILTICLVSLISFIFMMSFHLVRIDSLLFTIFIFNFICNTISSITILSRSYSKLKTVRIEEQTTKDLKTLIYKQSFKSITPIIFIHIIFFVFLFVSLGTIVNASLFAFDFCLFILGSVLVSLIYILILLPKILIFFEAIRARNKRKIILSNYWDTEKIKEQTFKGINNIK